MWMLLVLALALLAQAATPSPAPSLSPSPSPSPTPAASVGGDFTVYAFHTSGTNATGALDTKNGADLQNRADLSNLLLNLSAGVGKLRATATVGEYAFPTIGQALNPDTQPGANEQLYSALPVAALTYSFNSQWSVATGKFAALLGQESPFTYQNVNVQRGLGWSMEPLISRGVQVAYSNAPWTVTLQENDAYYSGHNRAFEGLIGWAPSSTTNVQFAAIVPGANVGSNPTIGIGNKAEYDLMFARQFGKLQLLPYILWVHSPASASLGYTKAEDASAAVLLGALTLSPQWTIAFRYEAVQNASSLDDTSPNADLIGYGPGSGAQTFTLTPTCHFPNNAILRLEYSHVGLSSFKAGLGFGPGGTAATQDRFGFEFGIMH